MHYYEHQLQSTQVKAMQSIAYFKIEMHFQTQHAGLDYKKKSVVLDSQAPEEAQKIITSTKQIVRKVFNKEDPDQLKPVQFKKNQTFSLIFLGK